MLDQYRTVRREASAEIVIKKSRFIGHVLPVESEEEAVAFIERIKKEHWSATHNCSAYVVGERDQFQKQSDDGEPSGTAGKPILEVIKQQGLKNTAVVVTRYFGGIMLGAGGLVRAYTDATVAGLAAAEPVTLALFREVRVEIDYTWHGKVENELRGRGTRMGDTVFTDKVTLTCWPRDNEAAAFIEWMTDLTQGQAVIASGDAHYKEA
ncbi:YigZ family protein [Paenibacillus flagellatus]|uniref:YigZ family protein n=1 Tax=Paenibacillus flagellatus TaxID=2211139 RepID=A0A2V5K188_9BACL|nr:YigZ family protein [Paenibacillus flagellatus]PYI52975.1 YigZ family protein [Paenibacillus flagellatus]